MMENRAKAGKLYFIFGGKVEVKVRLPEGRQVLIGELGPGRCLVGERSWDPMSMQLRRERPSLRN